jgi:hypothetical protein
MNESGRDNDIVELRAILKDDESGDATRALIQSLRDAESPIAVALRGTLSQEEYRMSEDLLQALRTAESVLKRAWTKAHPDRHVVF